jgi:hypothetical protein
MHNVSGKSVPPSVWNAFSFEKPMKRGLPMRATTSVRFTAANNQTKMLRGISPIISPELPRRAGMGHGDEDHYSRLFSQALGCETVLRADGLNTCGSS